MEIFGIFKEITEKKKRWEGSTYLEKINKTKKRPLGIFRKNK